MNEVENHVWEDYLTARNKWKEFSVFLEHVLRKVYGLEPDPIQLDIAWNMQHSKEKYLFIGAQRGQAKSTIGGAFLVWTLLQNPEDTNGIFSAGENLASDIAFASLKIVSSLDELAMLKPETQAGDRTSAGKWDVNHRFKGINKQPSVMAMGINANIAGYRLTLAIGDDLEQPKNSRTPSTREQLQGGIKELANLASKGRIILFGTYQTLNSVYLELASKGYKLLIYPGRFVSPDRRKDYEGHLAPWILENDPGDYTYGDGTEGAPTSPRANSEEALILRRPVIGEQSYALNVMLNPKLLEGDFSPLNPKNLMVVEADEAGQYPSVAVWVPSAQIGFQSKLLDKWKIPKPGFEAGYMPILKRVVAIDPAGGGKTSKNETALVQVVAIGALFVTEHIQGFPGGYSEDLLRKIALHLIRAGVSEVFVESNWGEGMWANLLRQTLETLRVTMNTPRIIVTDIRVGTQKSKAERIMDLLEPVIGTHKMAITRQALEADEASALAADKDTGKCLVYSVLQQLENMTAAGGLIQDDRIDAWATAMSKLLEGLPKQTQQEQMPEETDAELDWIEKHITKPFASLSTKIRGWGEI